MQTNQPRSLISRRAFLAGACLAGCSLHNKSLFAQGAPSNLVVTTLLGALRGVSEDGVRVFKGVPFAEPPVGPLRFKAPVKAAPWTGVRDATQYAAAPMQEGTLPVPQSEDCLTLNIWAPQGDGPFPVFVWIHGGGFTSGRASDPTYHGTSFAQDGIVCVTIAYRLGVFGFLDLEPLLGDDYSGSANNALRDIVLALEWVQENIAAFGGDPTGVTLGGQSAGAKLTGILMGVPSARPYFQQMISESGGAERIASKSTATGVALGFGKVWSSVLGQDVSALRTAPAADLIKAQQQFIAQWPEHFPLRPEVDGDLLPSLPISSIATGDTAGKRLLIGTNKDESAFFIGAHPTTITGAEVGNVPLASFNPVYGKYSAVYPLLSEEQRRIRALSAEEYLVPSIRLADAHVKAGGSAWMYRLDFFETSGDLRGYAYHSLDVGLVWNHPNKHVDNAPAAAALSGQMHAAWTAFIRGETPSALGLPVWTQYSPDNRPTMIFDVLSHVEPKPEADELSLWDGIL